MGRERRRCRQNPYVRVTLACPPAAHWRKDPALMPSIQIPQILAIFLGVHSKQDMAPTWPPAARASCTHGEYTGTPLPGVLHGWLAYGPQPKRSSHDYENTAIFVRWSN